MQSEGLASTVSQPLSTPTLSTCHERYNIHCIPYSSRVSITISSEDGNADAADC